MAASSLCRLTTNLHSLVIAGANIWEEENRKKRSILVGGGEEKREIPVFITFLSYLFHILARLPTSRHLSGGRGETKKNKEK